MIILFISLFFTLFFDARLLCRKNPEHYRRIMEYPPIRWSMYATLFCVGMLPIYLLRRSRFFREGPVFDSRDTVLAGCFEVLLKWACGVMMVVIALKLTAGIVPSFKGSLLSVLIVSGFSSFWMVALVAQLARRPGQPRFKAMTAVRKPQQPAGKVFAAAIFVGVLFAGISSYILQTRAENPATPLSDALQGNESSLAMVLFIVLGLGAAPLLEELIFRGYFYGVLETFYARSVAIVAIAGLFALMHVGQYWGDWLAIVMVTLLGLEITLLRAWSGSTWPGVVTHYCYNTLVSILPMIFLALSNPAYMKYVSEYPHLTVEAKEELLVESIHKRPEFVESYNDLAWLYAENHRRLDDALKLSEQALYRQPGNAAFLDTKAEVLYALGKTEEALVVEKDLVKRFPAIKYYREQLDRFEGKPSAASDQKQARRPPGNLSN
jgi:membrane protease YdiL (CAAX protease family)